MRDTIERKPLFVIAAEVSAELNRGVKIAKQLQLVASNARALALRAGESAAGFRPVTDSIDELVLLTFHSSNTINLQAQHLSQIATERNSCSVCGKAAKSRGTKIHRSKISIQFKPSQTAC